MRFRQFSSNTPELLGSPSRVVRAGHARDTGVLGRAFRVPGRGSEHGDERDGPLHRKRRRVGVYAPKPERVTYEVLDRISVCTEALELAHEALSESMV